MSSRPHAVGIIFFGMLAILFAAWLLIPHIETVVFIPISNVKGENIEALRILAIPVKCLAAVTFLAGIGLFMRKTWGRKLLLLSNGMISLLFFRGIVAVVYLAYKVGGFNAVAQFSNDGDWQMLLLMLAIPVGWGLLTWWYFARPSVKAAFA